MQGGEQTSIAVETRAIAAYYKVLNNMLSVFDLEKLYIPPQLNETQVLYGNDGRLVWRGENDSYTGPPDASQIERLEDWFIRLLPIDNQM